MNQKSNRGFYRKFFSVYVALVLQNVVTLSVKLGAQAMQAALAVALCLFVLVSVLPHGILSLFTSDEPIIREGMKYLGIIRFTYLFFAMTQILLAVLRSVETVKVAFYLSVVTFFINCGINFYPYLWPVRSPGVGSGGRRDRNAYGKNRGICHSACIYFQKREKPPSPSRKFPEDRSNTEHGLS